MKKDFTNYPKVDDEPGNGGNNSHPMPKKNNTYIYVGVAFIILISIIILICK